MGKGISCPTPNKRRFTEADATRAAISLSSRVGYGIRAYQCDAGGHWHLTRWQKPTKMENRYR